ncbi:TPA: thiamine pyrophosphate-binding protein [Photobacterium damselae]
MSFLCTKEKNTQILISLLKSHGIKNIIASPGATNVAFVGSIQNDPYFNVYSSVDERSAAYMACGLAEELREPVVLSCTGATASRNYVPGLTEAFYRKLPILAITSTQPESRVGHHEAQVIDRTIIQRDIAKISVSIPIVKDRDDIWECEVKINQAILELKRNIGGPVHINLPTTYKLPFEKITLPCYRKIERKTINDDFPPLIGKVAVFIGSHHTWKKEDSDSLDLFCESNNAVVFCDHTSAYNGKFRVPFSLVASQEMLNKDKYTPDILIHIGEISGDYPTLKLNYKKVWRVSEDGELRDTFRKLEYVFEMKEKSFFNFYCCADKEKNNSYFNECNMILNQVRAKIPELPLSNIWVASKLSKELPVNSFLHLGILNTLRSWNFFDIPNQIISTANVGGFGIDGALSTLVGSSLASHDKLHFCILGDLAFFYDMNALGNRHIGNNIRILIINNGKGTEFKQYNHHAAYFKEQADSFIAAADHFGSKSPLLVKNLAENLGFKYLSANSKNEFESLYQDFINIDFHEQSIIFEVFTNSEDESKALQLIQNIEKEPYSYVKNIKSKTKSVIRKFLIKG